MIKKLLQPRSIPRQRPRVRIPLERFEEIFIIGDVHGCLDALLSAETRISQAASTSAKKLIVMLGDYVDRGPDSALVVDHLIQGPAPGFERICLCGNHDDLFLSAIDSPDMPRKWLSVGGDKTLMSYGVDSTYHLKNNRNGSTLLAATRDAVPISHSNFLRQLPVCLTLGPLLLVHAGIRPGVSFDDQTDEDMMWIREPFLTEGPGPSFIAIHGHTPSTTIVHGNRRICVDTAAYLTGKLEVLRISKAGYSIL